MKRRNFLTLSGSKKLYPEKTLAQAMLTGLEAYTGPWDVPQVAHLLRRTMFGAKRSDIDYFLGLGSELAVKELCNPTTSAPVPPVNDYNNSEEFIDPDVPLGESWLDAPFNLDAEGLRIQSLKAWWVTNILNQDQSIMEKMILFWHNHIPIQFFEVFYGRWCYNYLGTIRTNALGNFRTIIRALTLDPGMLEYLNGQYNSKYEPDENYARELQELFCIGKGSDANFNEEDIQAAARVLTGWRVNYLNDQIFFDTSQHDTEDKQFSAFYGNTVIEGKSGFAGQQELDELINMLLANEETAKFICRKIYRFFVTDNISETVEQNVITPLAVVFRSNDYEIKPVMETLLGSQHFFDMLTVGALIKSPVDMLYGMLREFETTLPDPEHLVEKYTVTITLNYLTALMQVNLGDPPNVAGWQAYYQIPNFDKNWINTDTLPKRAQYTDYVLFSGIETDNNNVKLDLIKVVSSLQDPADPNILIDDITEWMYGIELNATGKFVLKSILLSGQVTDNYWTDAWLEYEANPTDEMLYQTVYSRLQSFFYLLLHLEEYQLV